MKKLTDMSKDEREKHYEKLADKRHYSFLHPMRRRCPTPVSSESKVQSEFARESDINYLVEKHARTGMPFPQASLDQFRDVSSVPEFQDAITAQARAQELWMSIDPKIRRHFGDKIEGFLSAIHDPERVDELVRLKIIKRPQDAALSGSNEPNKPAGGNAPKGTQGVPEPKAKGGSETPGTA